MFSKSVVVSMRELAEDNGRTMAGYEHQQEIMLGLTHKGIAQLTATSRQTVPRHLTS